MARWWGADGALMACHAVRCTPLGAGWVEGSGCTIMQDRGLPPMLSRPRKRAYAHKHTQGGGVPGQTLGLL